MVAAAAADANLRPDAPKNATEKPQDPARVALREGEPAQQQIEIVAIGLLHGRGGVVCGLHGLGHDCGHEIEVACARGVALGGGSGIGCCRIRRLGNILVRVFVRNRAAAWP